jgi:hypothetical protein
LGRISEGWKGAPDALREGRCPELDLDLLGPIARADAFTQELWRAASEFLESGGEAHARDRFHRLAVELDLDLGRVDPKGDLEPMA